jgi:hypothetical protein
LTIAGILLWTVCLVPAAVGLGAIFGLAAAARRSADLRCIEYVARTQCADAARTQFGFRAGNAYLLATPDWLYLLDPASTQLEGAVPAAAVSALVIQAGAGPRARGRDIAFRFRTTEPWPDEPLTTDDASEFVQLFNYARDRGMDIEFARETL